MLRSAAAAGIPATEFWQMTPRETAVYLSAAAERITAQRKEAVRQAWLTAALGRAKRIPPLKQLLTPPARPLRGAERARRRNEFRQMANPANLAAINEMMRKKHQA